MREVPDGTSILKMHTQRHDGHRTAVAVVGWVNDFLEVGRYENALAHFHTVEGFQDLLRGVIQSAVADDEIQAAGRQVVSVSPFQAVDSIAQADKVVRAAPAFPLQDQADVE